MDIRAAEISKVLKDQIANFGIAVTLLQLLLQGIKFALGFPRYGNPVKQRYQLLNMMFSFYFCFGRFVRVCRSRFCLGIDFFYACIYSLEFFLFTL